MSTTSQEQIWDAARTIEERGEKATLPALYRELRGGSFAAISEALQIRDNQLSEELNRQGNVSEALDQARELIRSFWEAAWKHAEKVLETERQNLSQERDEFHAERAEIALAVDEMVRDLEASKKALAAEHERCEAAEKELAERDKQLAAAKTECKKLQTQLAESKKEVEIHQAQMGEIHAKAANLESNLAGQVERRQQAETQWSELGRQLEQVQALSERSEAALNKSARDLEKSQKQATDATAKLETERVRSENANQEINTLRAALEESQAQKAASKDALKQGRAEQRQAEQQGTALNTQIARLEAELKAAEKGRQLAESHAERLASIIEKNMNQGKSSGRKSKSER